MYSKYNYIGATTQSAINLLSDVVAILTGQTTDTNLTGKWVASPTAYVGITDTSATVTWTGAKTDVTCSVGQTVTGTGIPSGATIATITDQVGFTLNTAHEATATNAQAILILGNTATLPTTQIGSTETSQTITSFSASTDLFTKTGHGYAGGERVQMIHTGGTATEFGSNSVYYEYFVKYASSSTFYLSNTFNGANIVTAGTLTGITVKCSRNKSMSLISGSAVVATGRTTDLAVGQTVTGYGVPAATTISSISAGVSFTMNNNATADVPDATLVFAPGAGVICDTTNTTISTSIAAAGWALHDQWAAVGQVIIKAPIVDDATSFKYVMLDVSNGAYLQMHLYEGWNNTTHVGTNQAYALITSQQQRTTLTVSASIAIAASARFIAMQSTVAAGVGSSDVNSWTGIFERSRLAPWDTVTNGYPPVVLMSGAAFGWSSTTTYAPRYKNPAGGDYTAIDSYMGAVTMGWNGEMSSGRAVNGGVGAATGVNTANSGTIKSKVPDGLGGFYTPFNEIQVRCSPNSFEGGSLSTTSDIWNTVTYPNNLDEVVKGSQTYIIWQNTLYSTNTTATQATGQNSGNTLFPKG